MSAPYVITAAARADLAEIYRYTAGHWGFSQADLYQASLTRLFAHLAEQPLMGVEKGRLGRGVRSHPVESHIVYYRLQDGEVEILRVLHNRQDEKRAFRRH